LTGDSYGMTDRDDTLWAIAQRSRPSNDVSVQQNMLAIVRLNPQAFIGGNINLLKAGYRLRLPTEADAAAVSATDAINQVAEQNQAWQAYRRGEPLSAVAASSSAPAPSAEEPALAGQMDATAQPAVNKAPTGPDGELRIVAGDNAAGGTGAGGGNADASAAALAGELAATKEETDRISRERDEAVGRLDQVTSQAEQAQRQIEVRDKQIAQLQDQMKALQAQAKSGDAVVPAAAKKEPAAGILGMLTSPLVLIGGAIVLVLIVVAGLMRARSGKAAVDDQLVRYDVPAARRRGAKAVAAVGATDDFAEAPAEHVEEELKLHDEDREPAHHEGAQTGDVIGEADIYIAYGRYPQAVSLLLGALDEDPDRHDVRLKLLEVYAETKAEAGFETQMQELLTRCNDNELLLEARELEAKLREDDTVVKAVARDEPQPQPPATPTLDEFQLDLDADEDISPPQREAERVPERVPERAVDRTPEPVREAADDGHADDLGGDLGIDFKADDDATVLRSPAASRSKPERGDVAVATAGDEDEFDLEDIEYEPPPRPMKPAAKASAKADESDDAFDFLNEEDAATTKLDLARAYIDMGDEDGAREILGEVLQEGSNEQQQTANELLAKLG
jgi:pilus assembly protein FimV